VSRTDRLRGSRHEQEPSNGASTMAFR
jgi:hypothetical protein